MTVPRRKPGTEFGLQVRLSQFVEVLQLAALAQDFGARLPARRDRASASTYRSGCRYALPFENERKGIRFLHGQWCIVVRNGVHW